MDLRKKLLRMRATHSALDGEGARLPDAPVGPATEAPATEPNERIAMLRGRLDELLRRTNESRQAKRKAQEHAIAERLAQSALPFEIEETAAGPLSVRTLRYGAGAHVGHAPLSAGFSCSARNLAKLALAPELAEAAPERALYLDTETTGLAGGTGTLPFLVGLGFYEEGAFVVEQLLLRRPGDEEPILRRIASRIAACSMMVTFNGKAFDWPLLRTRFVMNRVPPPAPPPHLDLVHVARRIHRKARVRGSASVGPFVEQWDESAEAVRAATSCKLVALERQILGFSRVGDVPSGEIPARYTHFLRTGDGDALVEVCDHNVWDIASMASLMGVYASAVESLGESSTGHDDEGSLAAADLVGLATTLQRAGDLERARAAIDRALSAAVDREVHALARRARAGLAKRTRDVDTAVADFEHLSAEHDDKDARLELAKIYEHALRDPARALANVEAGTSEGEAANDHRRVRLEKKATRAAQQLALGAEEALGPARKRRPRR